jgi:hypothetical protein
MTIYIATLQQSGNVRKSSKRPRQGYSFYTIACGNATLNITGTIGNEFTDVNTTTKDYEALKQAIEFHVTNAPDWISANQRTGSQSSKLELETDLICYNKEDRSSASCSIALVFK